MIDLKLINLIDELTYPLTSELANFRVWIGKINLLNNRPSKIVHSSEVVYESLTQYVYIS